MQEIREQLKNVFVETTDFETLQLFWSLRRFYVPSNETLTTVQKQTLTRGF